MDEALQGVGSDGGAGAVGARAASQPALILFALVYLLANGAIAMQGSGLLTLRLTLGGVGLLSFVVPAVSAVALILYPLIGTLSDRTASPLLRRRLYLIVGAVLTTGALAAVFFTQTLVQLALVWLALQIGGAAVQLMLLVALPEMIPARQRGIFASLLAVGAALGGFGGSLLVNQVIVAPQGTSTTGPVVVLIGALFAVCVLVSVVLVALLLRPSTATSGSTASYTDFGWTAVSRVYLATAVAMVGANAFTVFGPAVGFDLRLVAYAETALLVLSALATGLLSDRIGQRKPFVLAGALVTAAGALVLIVMPLATASQLPPPDRVALTIVGGVLLGAGSGTYLTAQLALATQVLPSARHYARDLGWMQLAALLPPLVLPFATLYLQLVAHAYGQLNYVGYVVFGALCAVLGGLAILRVRSAR